MALPDDWWTKGLEDEPCDRCGVRPSKHEGHGAFTCQACYEARWCPLCTYVLQPGHVCVTPEQHAINQKEARRWFAALGIEDECLAGTPSPPTEPHACGLICGHAGPCKPVSP